MNSFLSVRLITNMIYVQCTLYSVHCVHFKDINIHTYFTEETDVSKNKKKDKFFFVLLQTFATKQ